MGTAYDTTYVCVGGGGGDTKLHSLNDPGFV